MAGDPTKQAKTANVATAEPEASAECPACGSDNVRVKPGGAIVCGKCGVALTERVDPKTGKSAGYAELPEGSSGSYESERGSR